MRVLDRDGLAGLIETLRARGHRVIGPIERDGAIVCDEVRSLADLPRGWKDVQGPGTYRLERDGDEYFGYVVGPQSWKKVLFPPRLRLWRAERGDPGWRVEAETAPSEPLALFGVRPCELHAIAVLDRVLLGIDPAYRARRESLLVIAVQCTRAGGSCFCSSLGTGPRAAAGASDVRVAFDLALTELAAGGGGERFLVEIGSPRGEELLGDVASAAPTAADLAAAEAAWARALATMERRLDVEGVPELLRRSVESPRWDAVAARCLGCANCTMVCPTCFCVTVEDGADLAGRRAERTRVWDSCFTLGHSYLHGGSVRASGAARYRQWLTHKLSTWRDQFGTLGCVGCGRCITWCPTGIDLTAEVEALRTSEVRDGDARRPAGPA